jgi:peptide/nickel transport system substrate-binding protein
MAVGEPPRALDPAVVGPERSAGPLWQVYTPPLTYRRAEGKDGTELIPGVAARVPKAGGDGRIYTIRVRPNVRFSNGRFVRARDLRHSILRARALGPVGQSLFAGVASISANDETGAIRIVLRRPDPSFPHALAALQAGVVPAATPMSDQSRRPPPGVGPYRIIAARPGRGYALRRDRDFNLPGVPGGLLDQIGVSAGGTPLQQTEAVTADRLDVMITPPPADRRPELRADQPARYSEPPTLETRYLFVRIRGDGADKLRQALAMALDKPEAARRLGGLVRPTCALLPPALPGYGEPDDCPWGDPEDHPDLVRARKLVEDAGALGRGVTVAAAPGDGPVARLYVSTLRKLGLAAERGSAADADVSLLRATAPVPDPARFLVPLAEKVPLVVGAEALVTADELEVATDPDDVAKLAETLDRQLVATAVVVPYAEPLSPVYVSNRIDAANCARVHPVYGIDVSDLCLR